ncbi:MAG: HlyD family secretion protein [Burkholderiales bacterium]
MRTRLIAISAAALAACSGGGPSGYQGYVEGDYVNVAAPVGGRLQHLLVQRGQTVAAGAPLYELESDLEAAAKQQADAQLGAAEAELADLKLGRRLPEREVTQAQLAQAKAAEDQASQQLARDEAQYKAGGIAQAQLEASRADAAIRAARVRELSSQLQVSRLPAREDRIKAQLAQVEAARAAASQAAWRLDQKRGVAAQAALVADTLYREGEWVPAGSPVVRLLPPGNVKLRFYVSEPEAGSLRLGRKVVAHCDGCGADFTATVSYVSDQPEFTPPVIYSNESRAKLVFLVEARPAPEDAARLHPGQPLTVRLQ